MLTSRWRTLIAWLSPCVLAIELVSPGSAGAQAPQLENGPFARIALLRPLDGKATDFEAGYIRHLGWHQQAGDTWRWFGWSIWAGDHARWFVYATFGHAATDFDHAVAPPDDERDNLMNVSPHVEWGENGLYEYLPTMSRGSPEPSVAPRLEILQLEVRPDQRRIFEEALTAQRDGLRGETLWYRQIVGGGREARYVRLRPLSGIAQVLTAGVGTELPPNAVQGVVQSTTEIWTYRPTMSLLPPRDR